MSVLSLVLALFLAGRQDAPTGAMPAGAPRFTELLAGEALLDPAEARAVRAELLALPGLDGLLLATLEDWTTPAGAETDGLRLDTPRREALLALVGEQRELFREERAALVRATRAGELRAGLRLEGALARASTVRSLYALALRAAELGLADEVVEALEEGLTQLLTREPKAAEALRSAWSELPPELAVGALRALASRPSASAAESVRAWLGRRSELDAAVLLTLAALHESVDPLRREPLAEEVQRLLSAPDPEVVQAAATALGRLGSAESVPWLVEALVHESPAVQRAALGALRAIGGVNLPGSTTAWRSWYAREETWFQEHAPALLDELVEAEASEEPVAATRALLRSLTEHRLHRDELAEHVRPLLEHERPRMRILACQALERLESRRTLPWLVAVLHDPEPSVVSAAHAALCTLAGVRLGTEPAAWNAHLGLAPGGQP